MGLREDAASAAAGSEPAAAAAVQDRVAVQREPLPDIEYSDPITDVDQVPVHIAWIRVMRDVKAVRKDKVADIKTDKGGYRFNFRGIDQVLNAVGPALRRHGVMVLPVGIEVKQAGQRMRETLVNVSYDIIGPMADVLHVASAGEGLDVGERGLAKALTTAYRNLLIVALTIPTDDPKMDPDVVDVRREEPITADPNAYRDEITDPHTSLGRLRQIYGELGQHRVAGAVVVNEVGDDEVLGKLYQRVVAERRAAAGPDGGDQR
jgi:hypothetical protein